MNRLLTSPAFRGSKRLSGFLRYVVEQTLDSGGADLKERTIGVAVFGRSPDYDTSAEPVVRVSAGDLRKRIAQYYHEPGHETELRIDLPTGSYHPVFHLPAAFISAPEPLTPSLLEQPPVTPGMAPTLMTPALAASTSYELPPPIQTHHGFSRRSLIFGAVGATVAAAGGATLIVSSPGNAYRQFWQPMLAGDGQVLIFVGSKPEDDRLVMEDALALVALGGVLSKANRSYRILKAAELTPEILKQGPSLLIGGFTNPLARRLTQQLRFTFAREGDLDSGINYIQDRQNLNRKSWATPQGPLGASPTFTDFAIVSRVVDPVTDQIAVVSAGIRRYGTLAAAEFLSHAAQLESLAANGPRDWRRKNMQAVLSVGVKDGKASPPRVVASYFW